jgi:glycosyltransferase involved in cell wall biosynthesis
MADATDSPLSLARSTSAWLCHGLRLREAIEFDSPLLARLAALSAILVAKVLALAGRTQAAFGLLSKVHASAYSPRAARLVEGLLQSAIGTSGPRLEPNWIAPVLRQHVDGQQPTGHTRRYFETPERMLGSIAMVVKSPRGGERGVIVIVYSYALPLFARLFDIERIAASYFLVLEPSWSGYCTPDILCFATLEQPVFVQAYEPRDHQLIAGLGSNLTPVPVAANWWVDHRTIRPLADVVKDVDIIMIAGWADFKRHHRLFKVLKDLRRRGHRLKVVLIGYPMQRTKADIAARAADYGVLDQLEIYESIDQDQVNRHLNRAKVNMIWSRREGVNRAIVEGLFANVPCILREGFNYGFHYPYVNELTGRFASESDAAETILWMLEHHQRFAPRTWALANMTCQVAAHAVDDAVRAMAARIGEPWSEPVAVKVNGLHGQQYWDPSDAERFAADYDFLAACRRS